MAMVWFSHYHDGNSLKDLTVPLLVCNLMISTSNWESKTWLDTYGFRAVLESKLFCKIYT